MSYFIRVLCESEAPVTRRQLAEFIQEGAYCVDPVFSPTPESTDASQPKWTSFLVYCYSGKRPIGFERLDGESASTETREIEEKISSPQASNSGQLILAKLQQVKQIFVIEIDPVGISEDIWLMLDCVEAFLARSCGGIIYAPDDGFFDADLQRLF